MADTNVLARSIQKGHAHYQVAVDSVLFLRTSRREILVISPQLILEFYAACTRAVNGLGLDPDQALHEIQLLKQDYAILPEYPSLFKQWELLVAKYKPTNRRIFDTRHVAFMVDHQISGILTFNDQDFRQYTEIQVFNPFDVLNLPRR